MKNRIVSFILASMLLFVALEPLTVFADNTSGSFEGTATVSDTVISNIIWSEGIPGEITGMAIPTDGTIAQSYSAGELYSTSFSTDSLSGVESGGSVTYDIEFPDYTFTTNTAYPTSIETILPTIDINGTFTIDLIKNKYRTAKLYSMNNILNAHWKPSLDEVSFIEPYLYNWRIDGSGSFANIYTPTWDLSGSGNSATVNRSLNIYSDLNSRALEILGQDAVIDYETIEGGNYDISSGMPTKAITSQVTYINQNYISWSDAIQLLFKALGQEEYTTVYYMKDSGITGLNDPSVQNLDNIDDCTIYDVYAYVSRSNMTPKTSGTSTRIYDVKAFEYGFINTLEGLDRAISGEQFIQLAANMMEYFGEPVYNQQEINALLQVYGLDVPIAYGKATAQAWSYLKARGVLEVDFEMKGTVSLENALDICMRIKDEDSRTNFKEIQLTMDIGDALVEEGYFGANNVKLLIGDAATTISGSTVESDSVYYDYFILMTDSAVQEGPQMYSSVFTGVDTGSAFSVNQKVFVSSSVNDWDTPYEYTIPVGDHVLTYSSYVEIETLNGKKYYHIRLHKDAVPSDGNAFRLNSRNADDNPDYIAFPKGGGIYDQFEWHKVDGRYYLNAVRTQSFLEADLEGYFDDSSAILSSRNNKVKEDWSFTDKLCDAFSWLVEPLEVHATTTTAIIGSLDGENIVSYRMALTAEGASTMLEISNNFKNLYYGKYTSGDEYNTYMKSVIGDGNSESKSLFKLSDPNAYLYSDRMEQSNTLSGKLQSMCNSLGIYTEGINFSSTADGENISDSNIDNDHYFGIVQEYWTPETEGTITRYISEESEISHSSGYYNYAYYFQFPSTMSKSEIQSIINTSTILKDKIFIDEDGYSWAPDDAGTFTLENPSVNQEDNSVLYNNGEPIAFKSSILLKWASTDNDFNCLVSWKALKEANLVYGSEPSTSTGVIELNTVYGVARIDNNKKIITAGTTVIDLSDLASTDSSIRLFAYEESTGDLYVDMRAVYGYTADSVSVYGTNNYTNLNFLSGTDTQCAVANISTSKLISVGGNENAADTVISARVLTSYIGNDQPVYKKLDEEYQVVDNPGFVRVLVTGFVPTANWVFYYKSDPDSNNSAIAKLWVYYPMKAFIEGSTAFEGIPTQEEMQTTTQEAMDSQAEIAGYSVNRTSIIQKNNSTHEWAIREFDLSSIAYASEDLTGATHTVEPDGGIKYNSDVFWQPGAIYWLEGVGFIYNAPSADAYNHKDYLNGDCVLPIYYEPNSSGGVTLYNANVDSFDYTTVDSSTEYNKYGYYYVASSTDGLIKSLPGVDSGTGDTSPGLNGIQGSIDASGNSTTFAPTGIFYLFGGLPRVTQPVSNVDSTFLNSNTVMLGMYRLRYNEQESSIGKKVFNYGTPEGSSKNQIELPNNCVFYEVWNNQRSSVFIYYGDTSELSITTADGSSTDVKVDEIAYVNNKFRDWADAKLDYALTAIDKGSSYLILIACWILPIIGIIYLTALIGLVFISEFEIFHIFAENVFDPIKLLTFGIRDCKTFNMRESLLSLCLAYILFGFVLNGNLLKLMQWLLEMYDRVVQFFA